MHTSDDYPASFSSFHLGESSDDAWLWQVPPLSPLLVPGLDEPCSPPPAFEPRPLLPPVKADDDSSLPSPTPTSSPSPVWSSTAPPTTETTESDGSSSSASDSPKPKRPRTVDAVVVAEPVKRTHREIDADRRQKEASAVRLLEELTEDPPPHGRRRGKGGRPKAPRKRDKVAVLQASAEKIQRLQALVDRLTAAPNRSDKHVRALAEHLTAVAGLSGGRSGYPDSVDSFASSSALSLLQPRAADSLSFLDAHHSLYASLFMSKALSMGLISMDTGSLIDGNEAFFEEIGWSREELINRSVSAPLRALLSATDEQGMRLTPEELCMRPMVRRPPGGALGRLGIEEGDDGRSEYMRLPLVKQYPASAFKARELAAGRITSFTSLWRCLRADGLVSAQHAHRLRHLQLQCSGSSLTAAVVGSVCVSSQVRDAGARIHSEVRRCGGAGRPTLEAALSRSSRLHLQQRHGRRRGVKPTPLARPSSHLPSPDGPW